MMTHEQLRLEEKVEITLMDDLAGTRALAQSEDFRSELGIMKRGEPQFTLLVYDEFLSFGICGSDGNVIACVTPYSDEYCIDYLDKALSLFKQPIRVRDKTSARGLFDERLKPRTSLHWIGYEDEVMMEKRGVKCAARQLLESMPATKRAYALCEKDGQVAVTGMLIDDEDVHVQEDGTPTNNIICRGQGCKLHQGPIEQVEKRIREAFPDAAVIREPLSYCTSEIEGKKWSCLPVLFEWEYARKVGYPGAEDFDLLDPSDILHGFVS